MLPGKPGDELIGEYSDAPGSSALFRIAREGETLVWWPESDYDRGWSLQPCPEEVYPDLLGSNWRDAEPVGYMAGEDPPVIIKVKPGFSFDGERIDSGFIAYFDLLNVSIVYRN